MTFQDEVEIEYAILNCSRLIKGLSFMDALSQLWANANVCPAVRNEVAKRLSKEVFSSKEQDHHLVVESLLQMAQPFMQTLTYSQTTLTTDEINDYLASSMRSLLSTPTDISGESLEALDALASHFDARHETLLSEILETFGSDRMPLASQIVEAEVMRCATEDANREKQANKARELKNSHQNSPPAQSHLEASSTAKPSSAQVQYPGAVAGRGRRV